MHELLVCTDQVGRWLGLGPTSLLSVCVTGQGAVLSGPLFPQPVREKLARILGCTEESHQTATRFFCTITGFRFIASGKSVGLAKLQPHAPSARVREERGY